MSQSNFRAFQAYLGELQTFVNQDLNHKVLPYHRWQIYQQLGSVQDELGRRRRGQLGILAVEYVLPIWQQAQLTTSFDLQHLLALARTVSNNQAGVSYAEQQAELSWEVLETLGNSQANIPARQFYVAQATVQALFETLGRDSFAKIEIGLEDTDDTLDPWCSDTALWAHDAYAGREPRDSVLSREFWNWWLSEAVPNAWQLGNTTVKNS